MTDQPTAYVVMIGARPTAVSTNLATAQESALADEQQYSTADQYETWWDENSAGEWRLMSRRRDRGGRYSWTQRCVRAAPLLPDQPRFPALAVACPTCGSAPGQLCTSHSGTRPRRHDVHQTRTRAFTDQTRSTQ